ncbi:MAG: hypothetical protein ACFFER_02595 [Candidatus Thorarchaeota archaeon]
MPTSISSKVMDRVFQSGFDPSHALSRMSIFPLEPAGGVVGKPPTCFVKGTKVLMADGSSKAIETLKAATPASPEEGDVVLSVDGVQTYVVGMLAGPRPEPCVKIRAESVSPQMPDKDFEVIVSMAHTVSVDLSRLVHAWLLREGDYVSTTHGEAVIKEIELVDYKEDVWNMYLASSYFIKRVLPSLTPERLYFHLLNSSLGLTPKQHLVFGNGILSGALYVQIHAAELARLGYSLKMFV